MPNNHQLEPCLSGLTKATRLAVALALGPLLLFAAVACSHSDGPENGPATPEATIEPVTPTMGIPTNPEPTKVAGTAPLRATPLALAAVEVATPTMPLPAKPEPTEVVETVPLQLVPTPTVEIISTREADPTRPPTPQPKESSDCPPATDGANPCLGREARDVSELGVISAQGLGVPFSANATPSVEETLETISSGLAPRRQARPFAGW